MSKRVKILLGAASLSLVGLAYAQRPAEVNEWGEAYLRVNINPTDLPPMVNINPYNIVPKVEVVQMPEIQFRVPPSGCQNHQAFRTGIGNSVEGPLILSYLSLPQQAKVTLAGPDGNESIGLSGGAQITTAIFLQAGQRLEFDSAILYSGCLPN